VWFPNLAWHAIRLPCRLSGPPVVYSTPSSCPQVHQSTGPAP